MHSKKKKKKERKVQGKCARLDSLRLVTLSKGASLQAPVIMLARQANSSSSQGYTLRKGFHNISAYNAAFSSNIHLF